MAEYKQIRIFFTKIDKARYISHLDLVRTMSRALRRAKLPIWYTKGYNRRPYLTFVSPLSLGYEGLHENMDIRLVSDMDLNILANDLDLVMPKGLSIIRAAKPVMKARDVGYASWKIDFENTQSNTLEKFLAQDSIAVQKRTKRGNIQDIQLKNHMKDIQIKSQTSDFTTLYLTLPCGSVENYNPILLIDEYKRYTDRPKLNYYVTRTNLLDKDGEVFI